ncbi:GntR family transcriptional regulator [Janibacter cremeus]|uniref:GntR family transcriptional regulator n=1 Tax=Janibacter cremeus TaxID=1285192 RepID=UPI0023F63088|nr:GntR family transcriptional regulator [Janibacter cremeus]WEV78860.1 GntR family transcriptional regulator [Janibacter cremeus]
MTSSSASVRRPPTAQAFVLEQMRQAIVAGDLMPGQALRQDALAKRFGVSRVPLREALSTLESEGQVVYEPHRGYKVARLSMDDLLEVYRIRELLEAEAARLAVERADDKVVEEMRQAAAQVNAAGEAGDLLTMTEANRRFHFVMVKAAQMPRLERLIQVLWDATDTYRFVYYGTPANRAVVRDEHELIIDAFVRRDAESLIDMLDLHRQHAIASLRGFLEAG